MSPGCTRPCISFKVCMHVNWCVISQFAEFDPHMLISASNDRACVLWHVTPPEWTVGAGSTPAATDTTAATTSAAAATASSDITPDRLDTADASSGPALTAPAASATAVSVPDVTDTTAAAAAVPAANQKRAWGLHTTVPSDFSANEAQLYDTTFIRSRWRLPDKPNALQTLVLPSGLAGVACADASNVVTLFTLR
jgi:hypothetical protein